MYKSMEKISKTKTYWLIPAMAVVFQFAIGACSAPSATQVSGDRMLVSGIVTGEAYGSEEPLAGVYVWVEGESVRTDRNGFWQIELDPPKRDQLVMINYSRSGYAPETRALPQLVDGMFVTAKLLPVAIQKTINPELGGRIVLSNETGTRPEVVVELPPGFADFGTSEIQVAVAVVRPQIEEEYKRFPGTFEGRGNVLLAGRDLLRTFGTVNLSFSQNMEPITNVVLQKPARMLLRIDEIVGSEFATGDIVPVWWLDQKNGSWMREGGAEIVEISGDKYAQWSVGHFTWWNVDKPLGEHGCVRVDLREDPSENGISDSDEANDVYADYHVQLAGVDYSGASLRRRLQNGVTVVTGWRGHRAQLLLLGGANGDMRLDLGIVTVPDQPGSGLWWKGATGSLDPKLDCLQVSKNISLRKVSLSIGGQITDPLGRPIAKARILLKSLGKTLQSDRNGNYAWSGEMYLAGEDDKLSKLVVGVMAPPNLSSLEFADKSILFEGNHRVDFVARIRSVWPVLVDSFLSDSEAKKGETVVIKVLVKDNNRELKIDLTSSSGKTDLLDYNVHFDHDFYLHSLTLSWTGGEEGRQFVDLQLSDAEAPPMRKRFEVRWLNRAPIVLLDVLPPPTAGQKTVLAFRAEDPDGDVPEYWWFVRPLTWDAEVYSVQPVIAAGRGTGESGVITFVPEVPGLYSVVVTATDGRLETASKKVFRVVAAETQDDTGSPVDTVIESIIVGVTSDTTAAFVFHHRGVENGGKVRFECALNHETFAPCSSPWIKGGLHDGNYLFRVRAVDSGDRVDTTPAWRTWIVDTVAPEVIVTQRPPASGIMSEIRIGFDCNEDICDYRCTLDGVALDLCETAMVLTEPLAGVHSFVVSARDEAGNKGSATIDWDATAEWLQLTMTEKYTCGIRGDTSLWCWGDLSYVWPGKAPSDRKFYAPVQITTVTAWRKVYGSSSTICALKLDGSRWCMGQETPEGFGWELYSGEQTFAITNLEALERMDASYNWKEISRNCGIKIDGSLWCWPGIPRNQVPYIPGLKMIDNGSWRSVSDNNAIDSGGHLWSLSGTDVTPSSIVTLPVSLYDYGIYLGTDQKLYGADLGAISSTWRWKTAVNATVASNPYYAFCGIRLDSTLWCWGKINRDYMEGKSVGGSATSIPDEADYVPSVLAEPMQMGVERDWAKVYRAGDVACAIRQNGSLWCWGFDRNGRSGTAAQPGSFDFVPVKTDVMFKEIRGYNERICGVALDQSLWCWGRIWDSGNTYPMYGDAVYPAPHLFDFGLRWQAMALISTYMEDCARDVLGETYCWDYMLPPDHPQGQRYLPDGVPALTGLDEYVDLAERNRGDYWNACGVRSDRSLWCWGFNDYGFLGIGSPDSTISVGVTSPVQVEPNQSWVSVAVLGYNENRCSINVLGEMWCWGMDYGSSPTTAYSQIRFERFTSKLSTCALGTTGDGYCFDRNYPNGITKIASENGWAWIEGNAAGYAGLDRAGKLHWIDMSGNDTLLAGTISDWKQITVFGNLNRVTLCGLRANGQALCAGDNDFGQRGDGSIFHLLPTRVTVP